MVGEEVKGDMSVKKDWRAEVIARWRREDGIELHLHRDGHTCFWFPETGHSKEAGQDVSFEQIELWRMGRQNRGFERVEE